MIVNVNDRIILAIETLKRSQEYDKQARNNLNQFYNEKDSKVCLCNALNNNRIALEGYYKAMMALHNLSEDEIYAFLEIQDCERQIEDENWSYFKLKHLSDSDCKVETDLSSKEKFFISFVGMPAKDVAIAKKARSDGNTGSHFNEEKLSVSGVEEICNATAGLVDGQLLYLTNSYLNKEDVDKETGRIFTLLAQNFDELQHKSFDQCESDFYELRCYEKKNYSMAAIEKKRKHFERSLSKNLILTKFRRKYVDICLELDEAGVQRKWDLYKNLYYYISPQNRGTQIERDVSAKMDKFRAELFAQQSRVSSNGHAAEMGDVKKSITAVCVALALFVLILLLISIAV